MIKSLITRNSTRIRGANTNLTLVRFAGHSKWQNIRHDKAKNDARKSKEATLISGRIESCVRVGGKESNARLEQLLEKAKTLNVSKAVVEKAIKRGCGELTDTAQLQNVQYEFMGPGGVAIIVNALTDNKARTVSMVKNAMTYFQATLSPCSYMFDKMGEVIFLPKDNDESFDDVFEVALEIGAEDVEEFEFDDEFVPGKVHKFYRLLCDPTSINQVSNDLSAKGYKLHESTVRFLANSDSQVPFPEESSKGYLRALDNLDQINDVTDYYTNIEEEHKERIVSSIN
ncbi:YebC/PmpR family DNA-binding regulatory protein [Candida albicans P57072]|uniref:YebC/PmpR family DNA-binding regulatory protein n=1 Tax=Candida albicans P78048 TaxID=1094989 RepID=A0AB34PXA1_CANAX|nr:YebC/PmpR family DNA-binding regulatory protein [Candida albicans P57072]KGR14952.1 YebC/PmpR family DNA-binding regulatory protein [Candida albicans P78048]KGU12553.1 YebC/PmpR family DNA-binding regulatory protein [Candida albicans P87]KGU15218.1 YebC/PmpR family DNA-binding regulatory protein [Candida albicans L26]KHC38040.1 YebC/PmpR family DNA-binding regulatory protein [Candida albicans P76055]KHC39478.1 YebC/PmpR family DNA-binding regulatory protein [Candida albicans P76067]KHC5953